MADPFASAARRSGLVQRRPDFLVEFNKLLERNEGRRRSTYQDTRGIPTVGVGFNLHRDDAPERIAEVGGNYEAVLAGKERLSHEQINQLRDGDAQRVLQGVEALVPNFNQLRRGQRLALADMAYNIGVSGLSKFSKMLAAINEGDFQTATTELLNSDYAQQLPRRARRNANLFASIDDRVSAETLLTANADVNPDQAAKNRQLAQQTGLELDIVSAAPEEAQKAVDHGERLRSLLQAPVTNDFFSRPDVAPVVQDDIPQLSLIERLGRAYNLGRLTTQQGQLGYLSMRLGNDSSLDPLILQNQRRMQQLTEESGVEHDDWGSFLAAAAEVAGQNIEIFSDPKAGLRVSGGALIGGLTGFGLAGPKGAAGGLLAGTSAGTLSHFAMSAFEQEGGAMYIELIEEGVDRDTARWTSLGVGMANAALESVSMSVLLKPAERIARNINRASLRKQLSAGLKAALKSPTIRAIAADAAKAYGAGIAAEVTTEVLQEGVNILGSELAKEFSEGEFRSLTDREIKERLVGVAEKTFKAMVVLAAPGPSAQFVSDIGTRRKTVAQTETVLNQRAVMDGINEAKQGSKTQQRDPELSAEHTTAVLNDAGVDNVGIQAGALAEYAEAHPDGPVRALNDLGVIEKMRGAERNQIIQVPAQAFAEHILGSDGYKHVRNHVKIGETQRTVAEQLEVMKTSAREMEGVIQEDASLPPDIAAQAFRALRATSPIRPEETQQADQVQQAEADVVEVFDQQTSPVQAALLAAVGEIEARKSSMTDIQIEGRIRKLDEELSDLDKQITEKDAQLAEAAETGRRTTRLEQQQEKLLKLRDEKAQEQQDILLQRDQEFERSSDALATPDREVAQRVDTQQQELERLETERARIREKISRARQAGDSTALNRARREQTAINKQIQAAAEKIIDADKATVTRPQNKKLSLRASALDRLEVRTTRQLIREVRSAFRKAVRETRGDTKASQTVLERIIRKSGLSKARQATLLGSLRTIQSSEQLAKKLPVMEARILRSLERQRKQEIRAALKKSLNAVRQRAVSGKLKGKLTPDIQKVVESLREAGKLSAKEAREKLDERMSGAETIPSLEGRLVNQMLALVGRPDDVKVADAENLLLSIDDLITEGRATARVNVLARQQRDARLREQVLEAIGDERTSPIPNAEQLLVDFEAQALAWNGAWETKLRRIFASSDAQLVEGVIDDLVLFEEARANERGRIQMTRRFTELIAQRLGLEGNLEKNHRRILKIMQESETEKVYVGGRGRKFTHSDGVQREVFFTRSQLRKRWMELQTPELAELMKNEKSEAYTDEIIDAIGKEMKDEHFQIAKAQLDFYAEYYERINVAYEEAYGVSLPKIENYSPIRREKTSDQENEFLKNILYHGGGAPGSLKGRTPSLRKLRKQSDIAVMQSHIMEMEYFIAYNQKIRRLNAVFSGDNEAVVNRLRTNYGDEMLAQVRNDLDYFAKRGNLTALAGEKGLNTLLRNYSFAQLGAKPQIGLKQLASFPAYAQNVSAKDFSEGLVHFARNPFAARRFIKENSEFFQQRGVNIDQDFVDITRDASNGSLMNFLGRHPRLTKVIMIPIRWGDRGAILLGGYAHVHARMKAGATKEEAIRSFERLTVATQQSSDPDQLSSWQRSSSMSRILTQFMSSANALARAEYVALVEGARGRISKGEMAKRLIIYHLVIPNLITFIANGFNWDDEDQLRASILGSFNGLFLIGDITEAAVSAAITGEWFDLEIRHPLVFFEDLFKALRDFDTNDFTFEEIIDGSKTIERGLKAASGFIGLPLATFYNELRGMAKLGEGEIGEGLLLSLGWSPYIVENKIDDSGDTGFGF